MLIGLTNVIKFAVLATILFAGPSAHSNSITDPNLADFFKMPAIELATKKLEAINSKKAATDFLAAHKVSLPSRFQKKLKLEKVESISLKRYSESKFSVKVSSKVYLQFEVKSVAAESPEMVTVVMRLQRTQKEVILQYNVKRDSNEILNDDLIQAVKAELSASKVSFYNLLLPSAQAGVWDLTKSVGSYVYSGALGLASVGVGVAANFHPGIKKVLNVAELICNGLSAAEEILLDPQDQNKKSCLTKSLNQKFNRSSSEEGAHALLSTSGNSKEGRALFTGLMDKLGLGKYFKDSDSEQNQVSPIQQKFANQISRMTGLPPWASKFIADRVWRWGVGAGREVAVSAGKKIATDSFGGKLNADHWAAKTLKGTLDYVCPGIIAAGQFSTVNVRAGWSALKCGVTKEGQTAMNGIDSAFASASTKVAVYFGTGKKEKEVQLADVTSR